MFVTEYFEKNRKQNEEIKRLMKELQSHRPTDYGNILTCLIWFTDKTRMPCITTQTNKYRKCHVRTSIKSMCISVTVGSG